MFLFWIVKESLRFCEQAVMITRALGRVISCFSDPEELPSTTKELEKTHGVGIQQQRVGYTQAWCTGMDSCTLLLDHCVDILFEQNILHFLLNLTAMEKPSLFN